MLCELFIINDEEVRLSVLILVLMEDALRVFGLMIKECSFTVLILVLMEDALRALD